MMNDTVQHSLEDFSIVMHRSHDEPNKYNTALSYQADSFS